MSGTVEAVDTVVAGNYDALLSLDHLASLAGLEPAPAGVTTLPTWFQKFQMAVHDQMFSALQHERTNNLMGILATGVAALLNFAQENVTG